MENVTRIETDTELEPVDEALTPDEEVEAVEHVAAAEMDDDEFSAMVGPRDYDSSADIEQMWMREIGSVPLLSNKAVVDLARTVEEGEVLNEIEGAFQAEKGMAPDSPHLVLEMLRRLIELDRVVSVMALHSGVSPKKGLLATITDPGFRALSDGIYSRELLDDVMPVADGKAALEHAVRELSVAPRLLPHEVIELAGATKKASDLAGVIALDSFQVGLYDMEAGLDRHFRGIKAQAKSSRDQLVQANMRLVVSVAKRHLNWGLPLLDLVQEGAVGLMRAVEKFEYRKGYRFSTYATWWIMQAVRRAVDEQGRMIRIPVHMAEKMHKLNRTRRDLTMSSGRQATTDELGEAMESSREFVEMLDDLQHIQPLSLDLPVGEDGDTSLGDLVEDESSPAPEEIASSSVLRDQIREMLKELPDRERKIIELRFGLVDGREWTLEEVGRTMNLTRERIRQLEKGALRKLRKPSRARRLVGALD
ncbi:MAG: sigma-70 family RNA polymerase sigma factor [Dehalococcoidia bacterium]|jgi:RNA polymerase primary sigma factor|nr:sigma-70 family RNA polymerase sigma factor [Dehalococcoidia bacterium]